MEYFRRRSATVTFNPGAAEQAGQRLPALIDSKRLQMLGILLRKHLMSHKTESERQAVLSLKRAALSCDYDVLPQEGISVIRTVLRQHASDGNKVTEYVRERGEAALDLLAHPEHHRFVYELLKVPQIDERLECMLYEIAFEETLKHCRESLEAFGLALDLLFERRGLLRKLFLAIARLGNAMNRDSRAPQATHGFQLSSFAKIVSTKSTKNPKYDVLHVALAMLQEDEAAGLFSPRDAQTLGRVRSYQVYESCHDLIQGFAGLREVCETGKYTSRTTGAKISIERRRGTVRPGKEASIDKDDLFHERMEAFVRDRAGEVGAVVEGLHRGFTAYKELGAWFNDPASVYPPPRDDSDPARLDLLGAMRDLAEHVIGHHADVLQDDLRAQTRAVSRGGA